MRPQHLEPGTSLTISANIDDVESDSLTFSITVGPYNKLIYTPRLLLQIFDNILGAVDDHFF